MKNYEKPILTLIVEVNINDDILTSSGELDNQLPNVWLNDSKI